MLASNRPNNPNGASPYIRPQAHMVARGPSQRVISEPYMQGVLARCLRASARWVPHAAHAVPDRAADPARPLHGQEGLWLPGGPHHLLVSDAVDRERVTRFAKGAQRLGQGVCGSQVFVVRRVALSPHCITARIGYAALRDMIVHNEYPVGTNVLPISGFGVVASLTGTLCANAHGPSAKEAGAADVMEAFYLTPYLPARSLQDLIDEQNVFARLPRAARPTYGAPLEGSAKTAVAMLVLFDMAKALSSLEDAGILHRNIQPKHVLWDGHKWLLGDFEQAFRLAPHERKGRALQATKAAWVPSRFEFDRGADGRFVAPEHFATALALTPTPWGYDRWCLGATVLEALQFQAPWPTRHSRCATPGGPPRWPLDVHIEEEFAHLVARRPRGQDIGLGAGAPGRGDARSRLRYPQRAAHEAFWREAAVRSDAAFTTFVCEQIMAFAPQYRATLVQMQNFAGDSLEALSERQPQAHRSALHLLARRARYWGPRHEPSAPAVAEQGRWLRRHYEAWAAAQRRLPAAVADAPRPADEAAQLGFSATRSHFDFRAVGLRPAPSDGGAAADLFEHRRVPSTVSDSLSAGSSSECGSGTSAAPLPASTAPASFVRPRAP